MFSLGLAENNSKNNIIITEIKTILWILHNLGMCLYMNDTRSRFRREGKILYVSLVL